MMAHTPGPWKWQTDKWGTTELVGPNGELIIEEWTGQTKEGWATAEGYGVNNSYDAYLIAAAPLMRKAIEDIVYYRRRMNVLNFQLEKLDDYIYELEAALAAAEPTEVG